jgi:hypothetical protein
MMKLVLDYGQTVLINKVDFGRCGWRMPGAKPPERSEGHPSASHKQSRTRNKIGKK